MKGWERFRAFVYLYLRDYIEKPFSGMHGEWFKLTDERKVAIAAPRGMAKSMVFSFFYPLYLIVDQGKEVVLVSSSLRIAERFTSMVKREIEGNVKLKGIYGDLVGTKWTTDWIKLTNGGELQCIGSEGLIRGMRPDVIIADDIENDENVRSEEYRAKLKDKFMKAWYFMLKPYGQVIIAGTLIHPLSLLSDAMKNEHGFTGYNARKYVSLIDRNGGADLRGESIWPEQWPTALLYEERDSCLEAFEQERMNNPIPDELRKFSESDIYTYEKAPQKLSHTMTVDPAVDTRVENDYTAFVVVGTDEFGTMFIIEAYRKRMEPGEVVEKLFQLYYIYKPHTIGIEDVAISKLYRKFFDLEAKKRGVYPNLHPMKLDMSKTGRSKMYRIEALRPFFRQGKILLPKNDLDLKGEMLSFPTGKHDDLLDALSLHLEITRPEKAEKPEYPPNTFGAFWEEIQKKKKRGRFHKWYEKRHQRLQLS